ncbi:MAG: ATP-binding protein [Candidatus Zixiibacteriota bacterium]
MLPIQEEIKKLEKKDWQLWVLTLGVLLIFGVFILLTFFYSDLQGMYEEEISYFNYNLLFLGFAALSLLFVAYIVLKEHSIRSLRRDLINQKILTYSLEHRFQELKALFQVSTLVNSEVELPVILQMICNTVLKSIEGETLYLWLYDKKKERFFCAGAYSEGGEKLDATSVKIEPEIVSWITRNSQPLLLEGKKDLPSPKSKDNPTGTNLFVPLKIKKELKGILNVTTKRDKKRFDEVDLRLVSIFAENVTASLDKGEVYQELKSQTQALERTIQDLRVTQRQLVQSEKLRALGDIASGVAHDFNNILAVILGRTELLLKGIKDESAKKWLRVIEQVANNGTQIIRRLQEFTRTGTEKAPMEINANKIIQQVVDITRHKWKNEAEAKGIKIIVLTELGKIPPLEFDPSQLSEVLMNMVINAIDALPHGGKLILKSWQEGNSVYISVEDNGVGINQSDKGRIFDPFFTTKGARGVGLGLSMAYGIITRYGGEINVESELNQGSTFLIKLPLQKKKTLDLQLDQSLIEKERLDGYPSGDRNQKILTTCDKDLSQPHQERG